MASIFSDEPPDRPGRPGRYRSIWVMSGAVVLAVLVVLFFSRPSPAEREARLWLEEFAALRQGNTEQRLPDRPLSLAGQQVLVEHLVQPESRVARSWDSLCRRLPKSLSQLLPRLPLPRDQVMAVAPALIELPGTLELRRRLLEAALRPRAANRMYAVQMANTWPVQSELLPWLERLAVSEEPYVRMRVALMLHGIPQRTLPVERLLAQLEADQVSVVREAARYTYRSDENGETIPEKQTHAPTR